MANILKDILEAEKTAHKLQLEAENYKAAVIAEIEEETKRITDEKMRLAEKKVEELRQEHRKSVDASMKSAENESHAASEAFLKLEKEKSAEWVEAVFNRVINGEA